MLWLSLPWSWQKNTILIVFWGVVIKVLVALRSQWLCATEIQEKLQQLERNGNDMDVINILTLGYFLPGLGESWWIKFTNLIDCMSFSSR